MSTNAQARPVYPWFPSRTAPGSSAVSRAGSSITSSPGPSHRGARAKSPGRDRNPANSVDPFPKSGIRTPRRKARRFCLGLTIVCPRLPPSGYASAHQFKGACKSPRRACARHSRQTHIGDPDEPVRILRSTPAADPIPGPEPGRVRTHPAAAHGVPRDDPRPRPDLLREHLAAERRARGRLPGLEDPGLLRRRPAV